MEILSTKNYSQFKILDCNRSLEDAHVKKLIKAIEEKNLLALNPITVNERMEVIDGQHRLKAAKMLRVPIYYQISNTVTAEDIFALNSNKKNWNPHDYLKFYCANGKTDYTVISDFLTKYPQFPLSPSLQILAPTTANASKKFREGLFKVENITSAEAIADQLSELGKTHDFAFNSTFIRAYVTITQIKGFDFNRLARQIAKQPLSFVPCVNKDQYRDMMERLYNYEMQQINRLYFKMAS